MSSMCGMLGGQSRIASTMDIKAHQTIRNIAEKLINRMAATI
jgi:hypothetical protein